MVQVEEESERAQERKRGQFRLKRRERLALTRRHRDLFRLQQRCRFHVHPRCVARQEMTWSWLIEHLVEQAPRGVPEELEQTELKAE